MLKTSEIEGKQLNAQSVRSSVACCLGVDIGALAPVDQTALRDISDLLVRGVLLKTESGGRSISYELNIQF